MKELFNVLGKISMMAVSFILIVKGGEEFVGRVIISLVFNILLIYVATKAEKDEN